MYLPSGWTDQRNQDAIVTDPSLGMPTTVGSHVFASMKAKRNAGVVDKVVQYCHLKSDQNHC